MSHSSQRPVAGPLGPLNIQELEHYHQQTKDCLHTRPGYVLTIQAHHGVANIGVVTPVTMYSYVVDTVSSS